MESVHNMVFLRYFHPFGMRHGHRNYAKLLGNNSTLHARKTLHKTALRFARNATKHLRNSND